MAAKRSQTSRTRYPRMVKVLTSNFLKAIFSKNSRYSLLTIFEKNVILYVGQGSKYAFISEYISKSGTFYLDNSNQDKRSTMFWY